MKKRKQRLSLDRPATYRIKVPGELDERWSDWAGGMTTTVESEGESPPVTTLTGTVDQHPRLVQSNLTEPKLAS